MASLRRSWEKNWPEVGCALSGGLPRFVTARRPAEVGACVPVFCYHRIDADRFGADVAFLRRNGYTTLDADALADHMEGVRPAPERSVVLTIDDGASCLRSVAFPILRELRAVAVAFVCPGLHTWDARPAADGSERLCSWPEILEMHASGCVDFQSHTMEHRYVPRWPEPCPVAGGAPEEVLARRGPARRLSEDLLLARTMLESALSKRVRHLAFPQYIGTAESVRIGRRCGYRAFWWGVLPARPGNRPGDPTDAVVRVSGEFLRRLPGEGRVSLRSVLWERYCGNLERWRGARKPRPSIPEPVRAGRRTASATRRPA